MMKFSLLLFLLLHSAYFTFAQGENPLPWEPKEPQYDIAPQFPGGLDAMMKFIRDSTRYPEPEKSKNIQGYVMTSFKVNKKGKITDIRIVNGVPGGPYLASEAKRLLSIMPRWIPAKKKGKPVDADYKFNIPFLTGNNSRR